MSHKMAPGKRQNRVMLVTGTLGTSTNVRYFPLLNLLLLM